MDHNLCRWGCFSCPAVLNCTNVCRKAIVALKTLNCIIIPACLKYADNILYGYAKPLSIAPRRFMATPTQGRAQTGQFLIGRIGDVGSRISSPEMD